MTLFLQYDSDTDLYEIWVADGKMRPMPAGGGGRWEFAHPTKEGAQKHLKRAKSYLASLPVSKQTKKEIREGGE